MRTRHIHLQTQRNNTTKPVPSILSSFPRTPSESMQKYSLECADANINTLSKSNITVDTGLKEIYLLL